MRNSALLFLCIFICLFFSKNSIHGNNGSVAYIYPVSNISIDGNLNDWPADIQKIPLQNIHYGAGLSGPEDATAFWQGGYDPASGYLYIAALTTDDDYVKTPDNGHYSSHDFQVLYIDPAHLKKGSGVIAYEIDEDHRKIVNQEGLSFYPQLKNASFDDVELVIKRDLNTTIYEWKIKVSGALTPGRILGFDYAVFDKDTNEDNVMVTWGPTQGNKFMNSQLIGDLVLLASGDSLSNVSGTLEWKGEAGKKWPQAVVFNHQTNSDLFIAAGVDSLGNYSVKLPKGVYDISIPASWQMNKWFDIDLIKSGDHTTAIDVQNNKNIKVDAIAVTRIPKPALIPEKGLLHESFTKESAQQTDAFIEAYRDYYNIPGVSLAIIQDGKLVYHQTYGVENTITQKPLRDQAVFEAASITKLVFAYVMNRLIQRGEFDIDKPLYETLPFPELEKYPEYKLMTARHVLTHKSGLPNWGTEMKNTPGTVYGYSGEGFEYLKKVLAKGDFDSLPQIIQSHLEAEVLHPFGMTNTYFMCNEQLPELKVAGHINGIPNTYDCPEGPGMAFSMHTEAKDFVPFALALLNREGLTSAQATNMFRYHTVEKEEDWWKGYKSGFGLGVALRESPHGLVFGHGGNNGDFRCVFEMYDDLKSGYIMFTNSNTGGPLLFDLKDFLVEGKE